MESHQLGVTMVAPYIGRRSLFTSIFHRFVLFSPNGNLSAFCNNPKFLQLCRQQGSGVKCLAKWIMPHIMTQDSTSR